MSLEYIVVRMSASPGQKFFAVFFTFIMVTSMMPSTAFAVESSAAANVPTVTTNDPVDTNRYLATLSGNVDDLGDTDQVEVYFEFRESGTDDPWIESDRQIVDTTREFTERIEFLDEDTKFDYRAVVEGDERNEGNEKTFETDASGTPGPFIQVGGADNLSIWAGAAFHPRVDPLESPADQGMTTAIPLPSISADGVEGTFGKNRISVYDQDQTIDLSYNQRGVTTISADDFQDSSVDLVAVETEGGQDGLPDVTQIDQLLESEDNTARFVEQDVSLDNGSANFNFDPPESGNYVFFVTNSGSLEIQDGDVTERDNVRIVGVDVAVVQDRSSVVTPTRSDTYRNPDTDNTEYRPGENVTLDVETDIDDSTGDITHAAILYDETTLGEETVTVEAGSLSDISLDNVSTSTSIRRLEGVRRTDGNAELMGQDLGDRSEVGPLFSVADLVDFIGSGIGEDLAPEEGDTVINASVVAKSGEGPATTLNVGTLENFSTDDGTKEYSVIHIAENNETGELETNKETVTLTEELEPYATVEIDEEDSKLEVVDGEEIVVNATVTNIGNGTVNDTVELYLDDGGTLQTENIDLSAGESQQISLAYDTETDIADNFKNVPKTVSAEIRWEELESEVNSTTVTVADEGANFSVDVGPADDQVVQGDDLTVEADVTNDGGLAGTQTIEAKFDGTTESAKVSLDQGETKTEVFTFENVGVDPGNYTVNVSSENDFEKVGVDVLADSNFDLAPLDVDSEIPAGEVLRVNTTVENVGDVNGTRNVQFSFGGSPVNTTEDFTLTPGETRELNFTVTPTEGDDGNQVVVETNDTSESAVTETITVLEPADFEINIDEDGSDRDVVPGGTVTINATVTNNGDQRGERTVTLSRDGQVTNKDVEVAGDSSKQVTFDAQIAGDEPTGNITFDVSIDGDTDSIDVRVVEGPYIETVDVDDEVAVSDDVTVDVTVRNPLTDESKIVDLRLSDESQLDTGESQIGSESSGRVLLNTSYSTPGERNLTVDALIDGDEIDSREVNVSIVEKYERTLVEAPRSATVGEEFDVVVSVTNNRDSPATIPVEVTGAPDGSENEQNVNVSAGETKDDVKFSFTYDSPGDRTISLREAEDGDEQTVNVTKRTDTLVVTAEPERETTGENITFTVENGGTVDGVTLTFERDNETVTIADDVDSGYTTSFAEVGEYTVTAEDARDRDSVDYEPGSTTFTVAEQADVSLTGASTKSDNVTASTNVLVSATVNNTGGVDATETLQLVADTDGETDEIVSTDVTIEPGTTADVDLSGPIEPADVPPESRDLVVQRVGDSGEVLGDAEVGTVEVISALRVTEISPPRENVSTNDTVEVDITVENAGTESLDPDLSSQDVTLTFQPGESGERSITREFSPSAGSTQTLTYTFESFNQSGPKDLRIEQEFVDPLTSEEIINVTDRPIVDLELTANETNPEAGDTVSFTVTAENRSDVTPEATLEAVPEDDDIDSVTAETEDGEATLTFDVSGTYQVETTDHELSGVDDPIIEPGRETITVLEPGDLRIVDASVEDEVARTDDAVVTAEVINDGETSATENVSIVGRTNPEARQEVTLSGGKSTEVELTTAYDTTGFKEDVSVSIDGSGAEVVAGDVQVNPALQVTDVRVSNRSGSVGDTVTIEAEVTNLGEKTITGDPSDRLLTPDIIERDGESLEVDGKSAFSEGTSAYEPGDARTITFRPDEFDPVEERGVWTVAVDGTDGGTIDISRRETDLSLDVSGRQVGEDIIFNVTADGDPVDATIFVDGGEFRTGSDGTYTREFSESDREFVRVTKADTETRSFNDAFESIRIVEPADIGVTDAEVNTTQRFAGQSVKVTAFVRNEGGSVGTETIEVRDGNEVLVDPKVTLGPEEGREITFTTELNEVGARTLTVRTEAGDGETTGTVLVDEAVAITDTEVPSAVVATEPFDVMVTVKDRVTDQERDSKNVTISVAGKEITRTIRPEDGGSETATFGFTVNQTDTLEATRRTDEFPTPVSVGEIDVSESTLDLDLATDPDPAEVTAGEEVNFTVTREQKDGPNTTTDATVEIVGSAGISRTLSTGSDGNVSTSIPIAGNYTATATKGGTTGTGFVSDSETVNVSDPIDVEPDGEFGEVQATPVDSPSANGTTLNVTINNTGGRAVDISGLGFTGEDPGQYRISGDVPSSVGPGNAETVTVAFEPTVRMTANATLRFRTDTPRNPLRTLEFSGKGLSPDVEVDPTSIEFGGEIAEDDPEQTETITVSNEGNEPLSVNLSSLEDFDASPDSTTIQNDSSRDITVTFDPEGRSPSAFGEVLELTTNDSFDETVTVPVTATVSQGELSLGSNSTDVGELAVGNTTSFDVVVSNTGTKPIDEINTTNETTPNGLSVVAPSDDGPVVEGLDPGSQRLVEIELRQDEEADSSSAELTFVPGGDADNRTVQIDATPIAPELSVTPEIDDEETTNESQFGDVANGSTTTETYVVANDGDAPLRLTNISIDGADATQFSLPEASETVRVPADENRSITVRFNPQTTGTFGADLTFDWNNASADGTTELSADLAGTGTETDLVGSRSTVSFGTTGSGSTIDRTLTLTNDGNTDLTISDVTVGGSDDSQFNVQPLAGETLAAGDDVTVSVEYAPDDDEAGEHTAELTVNANSTTGDSTFTSTLQGEATPPEIQITDTSLEFGYVNSESSEVATLDTEIENVGPDSTTLNVTDASVSGDAFTLTKTPSQAGDEAEVEFNPDTDDADELTGNLTIETYHPENPTVTVPLRGVATAPSLTDNRSATVAFGEVQVGTTSVVETVGITNDGGAPAEVNETSLEDSDFELVSGFDGTLVPGETAPVTVRAAPTSDGTTSTELTVKRKGSDDELAVQLDANGTTPNATVTDDISGEFGEVGTSSSAVQTLSIGNDGEATLVLTNVTASTEAYRILGGQDTTTLGPDETTDIGVAFAPTAQDETFEGTLSIDTNDGDTTIIRELNGTGATASTSISESSVDFGGVPVDSSGEETELELTNDGDSPLNVTQVTIVGADSSAFDVSDFESFTLDSEETEAFNVSVNPSVARSRSAQLTIGTDTEDVSDVSIALGATGTAPEFEVSSQQIGFDRTRLGATSTETFELRNTGNSPLGVESVFFDGPEDQFSVSTDSTVVPADESRTVEVRFTPNSSNVTAAKVGTPQETTLEIRSNDTNVNVDVTGRSKTPEFQVPSLSRFGTLRVGQGTTQTLDVSNAPSATANITLEDTQLIGADAGEFDVESVMPADGELAPGEEGTIDVNVTAQTPGDKSASLLVTTNDPRQSIESVSLSSSRTVVIVRYGSVTFDYNGVASTDPKFKASNGPNTGVTGIDPTLNTVTNFTMTFSTRAETAGPTLADETSTEAVRYLNVDTEDLAPSRHNETTVQFRVSKATISNLDSVEDGITLYQYNDDSSEYTALETTRLPGEDTASEYAYTATIDSFGDLAIGAGQPDLSLTNASVVDSSLPDTLADGDSTDITVEADIENAGSIAGSDTVRVTDSSGATLTTESANVDVSATETVSLTVPITGPGTRTLTVEAVDDSRDVTVDIDAPSGGGGPPSFGDDDDDDDRADDDDDDGADDTDDSAGADDESPAPPASLEGVDVTATEVVVPQNISANQRVAEFETVANVDRITFNATDRIDEVQVSDIDPANGTVETLGSTLAVQDITVSANSSNTSATIEFTIPRDRLDEVEATPEELRTFRTVDGEFEPLNTTVEEANETVAVTAETPGFSVFTVSAVSEPEAVIDIAPDTIQPGDTVELSANGSENKHGEITSYNWSAGGDTLTGETAQTTFDEAGEYTVELTVTNDAGESNTTTANLVVEAVDDGTDDDSGDDDGATGDDTAGDGATGDDTAGDEATGDDTAGDGATDDDGQTDDGIPGFSVIVALIALIAAAGIAASRRS